MAESTPTSVECPICGETFDPTAAGGWCTNDDCGEWKYEGEGAPEPAEDVTDDLVAEVTGSPPDRDGGEGAAEPDGGTHDEEDMGQDVAGDDGGAAALDADDEESEPEADADGPDAEVPEPRVDAAGPDAAADDGDSEPDVDAAGPDAAADDGDSEAEAESATGGASTDPAVTGADEVSAVVPDECPDCGAGVDPDDNFCASCGGELPDESSRTLDQCPACGQAVDDVSFCPACGEDLDAHRADLAADATAAGEAPAELVLEARGRALSVGDGDTVGREFRRIVSETGGDEDEAVRIHREHVRFVREGGRFYLVDLGDNPTAVNEEPLDKGSRTAIGPGDTLTLSGVVTAEVEAP